MSRVFISTALVASVSAQTCSEVGAGGLMFPAMNIADATCTDITGCLLLPAVKLCLPWQSVISMDPTIVAQGCGVPINGACPNVIGCAAEVADQELTCTPTSCQQDTQACNPIMFGGSMAPANIAGLVNFADSACSGQCAHITTKACYTPNPVAPPTVVPAPTDASCYMATSMSACTAMDECGGVEGAVKMPCDDVAESSFSCLPCSTLGFFSSDQPIVKWLQGKQGQVLEAENAAGDGSYKVTLTALDASSCSWYAAADASAVTEVEALNYVVG
jgi:hypothetical protein